MRAEDLFGFVRRVSRDMTALCRAGGALRTTIKGDYGRQLATGAVRGQREALAGNYGEDPDARSHGETFLNLLEQRLVVEGLYFLDEPEAPLSPLRHAQPDLAPEAGGRRRQPAGHLHPLADPDGVPGRARSCCSRAIR